jgi:hypothetical protein
MGNFIKEWDGLITVVAALFAISAFIKKTTPSTDLFLHLLVCAIGGRFLYSQFYPETLIWWIIVFSLLIFLSKFIKLIYLSLFLK